MMPAAKHGDPQLGVDIHLCTVPPSPSPVPLPTPHTSIVFDPFDYAPIFGATVTVCGMKRATAGTSATTIHIPPGFPFAPKLPDKDDELFMGSSTVIADGDPFSFVSVPVLGCQIVGMPSPPRPKKKGPPKAMLLPTSVNLAIPTNVVVGGPPTISLMGMAFKGAFSALGRFARSGLFRRMRQRLFRNLNPGFLKCTILRAEPVNILSGEVSVEQQDFTLPGRIPMEWVRSYTSGSRHKGLCGHGWETPADIRLEVDSSNGIVSLIHPTMGPLMFEGLPDAQGNAAGKLELMDGARLTDHGDAFRVRTKEDRIYYFSKQRVRINEAGATGYPITRIADLCGNEWEFEYRGANLVRINESAGRCIELVRKDGRITEVVLHLPGTDTRHVFVRYEYDRAGNLVSVIDALDQPYTFAYDTHHMVRHTDRNGLSFYYEYEKLPQGDWRVAHAWGDGDLYNYQFEYFDALNERRITDSLGHVSIVKLDESGLPISEINPLGGMTIFEYDDAGRTTAVVNQDSHRTEYQYDARGNLLKLTRPDGKAIAAEFNTDNKAVKITDPNGDEWRQEWDARGLLTKQVSPLGAESIYEYDAHGQLIGFINPMKARTDLAFDQVGNLASLTDALGHDTRFAFDVLGNVTAKTDPLNQTTRYTYDLKSRLTRAGLPSGAAITCAYDHEDNLTRYVDENGAETRLEYFGIGEIKRRIQPDGHSVEYHYDTEERLIGATNQRGERYQLIRDPLGRIIQEIDYWGQSRRYDYTASGYLKQSVDPLGRVIQFKTDPLGRILKKLLSEPTNPDAVQTESFEYDANGNLIACENSAIRIQRRFDAEGRLVEEQQGETNTITNTYDLNGNRIIRSTNFNINGERYTNTVHYQYDALDQAMGVEVEGHAPLQFTRNALGQVIQEQLSDNVRRDFAYSADGYLTAQRVIAAEGPLFEQRYRYDRAGNLTEKHDSVLGVDKFTYDPIGRLTSHLNPEGRLKQYLNDSAGDRLRTRVNHLTQDEGGHSEWRRDGEYEGTYYRFDRAGNLVERAGPEGKICFLWEANQRLSESRTDDNTTIYRYDPLGRRISKETAGRVARFFWDGDALVGDAIFGEQAVNGSTLPRCREWVYYPETFEPLAMLQSDGVPAADGTAPPSAALYLYHNDPNGCPTRLLDTTGEVVWAAQYGAWGAVERLLADRVDNPIRLQGQYWDGETGLSYNRNRYYDSRTGQYIGQDLLRLGVGLNLYEYAVNLSSWIDPLGLNCKVLYHGTDVDTANRIVAHGINVEEARRLGGGDIFWMAEDLDTARIFAQANPAEGLPAVVGTRLSDETLDDMVRHGVVEVDAGVVRVLEWDAFNQATSFFRVE